VRETSALQSTEQAETALEVVLRSLVRRLTPNEAKDLLSQLPSLLQPKMAHLPPGPDKLVTPDTIESELVGRLNVDPRRAGELLSAVANTIAESVSRGQMEDVQGQLPRKLRTIFTAAQAN
jgi:uncharacterized protein (DUF2267 family)